MKIIKLRQKWDFETLFEKSKKTWILSTESEGS